MLASVSRSKWTSYARARDEMLKRTDSKWAPWWVLPSDDKKAARLNCISHLLSLIDYEDVEARRERMMRKD